VLGRRGGTKIIPIHEVSGFGDGEVLDVPGSPRVVHAPGHTDGSAAILLEDRSVLFTGDVLCTHNAYTGRVGPQIMPSGLNADTPRALASLDCPAATDIFNGEPPHVQNTLTCTGTWLLIADSVFSECEGGWSDAQRSYRSFGRLVGGCRPEVLAAG
jgi:hypothetical protein